MLAAVTASASHPAVATLLGLGAAAVAGVVVAMAWNVHARQIRLAEQLSRRQPIVTVEAGAAGRGGDAGGAEVAIEEIEGVAEGPPAPPQVVIEGPGTVLTGEQASYRMRPAVGRTVMSWAVGGGSVSQALDPAHPGELLLIADEPGRLTITAYVRDGLTERSGTKSVTATAAAAAVTAPPFMVRLFLQGWGLVVVAVLIVGFAGALGALGNFASSDFVALVSSLAALLGVVTVTRGTDSDSGRNSKDPAGRGL